MVWYDMHVDILYVWYGMVRVWYCRARVWYGVLCIDGSSTGFCALLPSKFYDFDFLRVALSQCTQGRLNVCSPDRLTKVVESIKTYGYHELTHPGQADKWVGVKLPKSVAILEKLNALNPNHAA